MRPLDQLSDVPIENLSVGDAAFRRKLKRAGYATLPEAFDAPDRDVDQRLGRDFHTIDALDALKRSYQTNPSAFVAKAMDRQSAARSDVDEVIARHTASKQPARAEGYRPMRDVARPRTGPSSRPVSQQSRSYVPPMPTDQTTKQLLEFEARAKGSLDALADRGTDYLAFEAFEDFAAELDELSSCFKTLLRRYQRQMRTVYEIILAHIPNAFILFCADQVRVSFDGENLWGNLFASLGITKQTPQQDFKRLMIECLEKRGMPTYGSDERDFYYFYTAMLHGGLSQDLWRDLWDKVLLPIARKAMREPSSFGYQVDGRKVLAEIREGSYVPNATTLNILGKASEATLVPMLDAALSVAQRLTVPSSQVGVTMLTSSGLPDTALDALSELQGRRNRGHHGGKTAHGGRQTTSDRRAGDLLYLPESQLLLDLGIGQARIRWKKCVLPDEYQGDRVDFFVNGVKLRSAEVVRDVRGCIVEEGSVTLPPMPGYEVEIKLMHRSPGDAWAEEASLEQAFMRTKPGCLEFLQMPDGTFRLRRRGDRIARKRTVAYVIKGGRKVVPGPGMEVIETRFTSAEWGDRTICLFEVSPGASGSIVEEATGRELATWQEDVTVTIEKSGCIGFASDGVDVYGVMEGLRGENDSLPVVTVEAADGVSALDDLDVVLVCDGRRYSVMRRVVQGTGEQPTAIALPLREVAFFPRLAQRCTLVVRRKSLGVSVFTYAFAVVPLRNMAVVQAVAGTTLATYMVTAAESAWLKEDGEQPYLVEKDHCYLLHAPLSQEWAQLSVSSEDESAHVDISLQLAGVSVEVGDEVREISSGRPLSYADAYELGVAKGEIIITAHGACERRHALLMLGDRPVFYRDMSRPGIHYANVFSPPELLLRMPDDRYELGLTLTVFFGDTMAKGHGWVDLPLLRCREGLGFLRPQVLNTASGHILYLGTPATCDLGAEVFWPARSDRDEKVVFRCQFPKDSDRAELPMGLVRHLDAHRRLWIRYYPLSLFGEPEYDYSLTMPFER